MYHEPHMWNIQMFIQEWIPCEMNQNINPIHEQQTMTPVAPEQPLSQARIYSVMKDVTWRKQLCWRTMAEWLILFMGANA